ncbi:hypothetical protein [Nonomuraea sp. NPDC049625]
MPGSVYATACVRTREKPSIHDYNLARAERRVVEFRIARPGQRV